MPSINSRSEDYARKAEGNAAARKAATDLATEASSGEEALPVRDAAKRAIQTYNGKGNA